MKRYVVELTDDERAGLSELLEQKHVLADRVKRARILLLADAGLTDEEIVDELDVGIATVERTRRVCVLEGLAVAVERKPQVRPRLGKLDGVAEAKLVYLACSSPPQGRARWTLRLLAWQLVELEVVDTVSYETVRQVLKKTSSSPGLPDGSVSRRAKMRRLSRRWSTSSTSTSGLTTPSIRSSV